MFKNYYDLYFFNIDTRDFYTIEGTEGTWYCGELNCGCGELEIIEEAKEKGLKITKVPLYKTIKLTYEGKILGTFLLGLIIGLIIN